MKGSLGCTDNAVSTMKGNKKNSKDKRKEGERERERE
jgi:hypothetical protein